jgi:hypothetical protein
LKVILYNHSAAGILLLLCHSLLRYLSSFMLGWMH